MFIYPHTIMHQPGIILPHRSNKPLNMTSNIFLYNTEQLNQSVQVFISTGVGGTGLNLQAPGALINLDIPWNPAV